jgi:hypothetical protein
MVLEFLSSMPSAQFGTMANGNEKCADLRSARHLARRVHSHQEC